MCGQQHLVPVAVVPGRPLGQHHSTLSFWGATLHPMRWFRTSSANPSPLPSPLSTNGSEQPQEVDRQPDGSRQRVAHACLPNSWVRIGPATTRTRQVAWFDHGNLPPNVPSGPRLFRAPRRGAQTIRGLAPPPQPAHHDRCPGDGDHPSAQEQPHHPAPGSLGRNCFVG
jgi:hypothetical protein